MRGWHWSEKNLTAWSKEQLEELLVGVVAIDDASKGWCKVLSIESMVGDVTLQARKQKQFPLYELEITLKWEGQLYDENGSSIAEATGAQLGLARRPFTIHVHAREPLAGSFHTHARGRRTAAPRTHAGAERVSRTARQARSRSRT